MFSDIQVENAKPLRGLYSPHRQKFRGMLGSITYSSVPSIQSSACKKEKDFTLFTGIHIVYSY